MSDINKALNEATSSAGGYLVPDEFSNRMLALIQAKSVTMQDLDVRQMISDVQYIPKKTDGNTAYWVAEQGTITASDAAFGRITLTAKKVAALQEASSEVLEDNNVALANSFVDQMTTDISLAIDGEIYTGTGGTFEGYNYTGSFTNAVDAIGGAAATAAAGTASTVTGTGIALNGIVQAVTEVLKDNHQQPDVSYWNPRTIGSLMKLTDGNGRPMLNQETYGSPLIREGVMYTLYGTKVRDSTQVPVNLVYGSTSTLSASSDAFVGKSKMTGILGQRRGFIWKTDYVIATDKYQYQTTARMAFSIKYPEAYCMIRGITD